MQTLRRWAVRIGIRLPIISQVMNRYYNALSYAEKERWHREYSCLDGEPLMPPWSWEIGWPGCRFKMPLKYWEQLLTVLGYDTDQKRFYDGMLWTHFDTDKRFVDIGANFGTHSFLALSRGLSVYAFEPNYRCIEVMQKVVRLNGWQGRTTVFRTALSDRTGVSVLYFPRGKSWLGMVGNTKQEALKAKMASDELMPYIRDTDDMEEMLVSVEKLDEVTGSLPAQTIVKIDVEGHELAVLRGAANALKDKRYVIFFESFPAKEYRTQLYAELTSLEYPGIREVRADRINLALSLDEFVNSEVSNFIATYV